MLSRPLRLLASIGAALAIALTLIAVPREATPVMAAPPSVTDPRNFTGVNVAWYNWGCDFGCPGTGVSSPASQAALSEAFGRLKAAHIHAVRWWTFEGTAQQIIRDSNGSPTGLNPAVYADFDAALALADKYDLSYDFVLFSAQTGLPSTWFTDPDQRQHLASALAPVFERYKNNPHILAWEIINEPEYDIPSKIPLDGAQATVKLLASTIHAHTTTPVTVGSATLEGVLLWQGLGLDFYSPHWYDQMGSGLMCARCIDVATVRNVYGVDNLPIVLGEFYGGGNVDTLQRLKDFWAKGYSGGWAWSLFPDRTQDRMGIELNALSAFNTSPLPPPATPAPAGPSVQLLANWVSPTYLTPGQTIEFHQDAVSRNATNVLVDFEVYDSDGQKVWQSSLDNQSLSANTVASFSVSYAVPNELPAGQYTLKTGAFAPGGSSRYAWADTAGSFVVAPGSPAPGSASASASAPAGADSASQPASDTDTPDAAPSGLS
jgi:hypothetical protein